MQSGKDFANTSTIAILWTYFPMVCSCLFLPALLQQISFTAFLLLILILYPSLVRCSFQKYLNKWRRRPGAGGIFPVRCPVCRGRRFLPGVFCSLLFRLWLPVPVRGGGPVLLRWPSGRFFTGPGGRLQFRCHCRPLRCRLLRPCGAAGLPWRCALRVRRLLWKRVRLLRPCGWRL